VTFAIGFVARHRQQLWICHWGLSADGDRGQCHSVAASRGSPESDL